MADDMLTGSLEENVLTILCYNAANAPALAVRITPDLFSTRAYRDIAKVAINHLERFNVPPGAHLRDMFEDKLRKGTDDGKLLRQTFDAMDALAPDIQADYVLAELDNFIESRHLSNALETSMELLAKGKLREAQDAVHAMSSTRQASPGVWLHKPEESLAFLDVEDTELFSSGIPALDAMQCVPRRRGLFLWLAPPNAGKTWALINCGQANIMRGRNVLHVTLEMEEADIAQRYVQAMFALTDGERDAGVIRTPNFIRDDLNRVVSMEFNEYDAGKLNADRRDEIADRLRGMSTRGKLLVKSFPSGSLSVPQLSAYLQFLRRTGFVPDIVLLDYWDLMAISADNLRVETGRVGVMLRGLAQVEDIAMVTATQGGRASATAKVTRGQHVAEDWSKMMTTDSVVTYSQTEPEESLNLARLWVEKARKAKRHYMVLVSQSYATGQFCIDSALMDSRLREQVKAMTGGEDAKD
jgi:hypothetical protein